MSLPPPQPDHTCIVTGASSGIGADLARELARRGRGVTLVARRAERMRELAATLGGVRTEVIAADLADPDARRDLPAELERRGLVTDVLVNNAGIGTSGPVTGADRDEELQMIRLNVEAVVDLCSLFAPGMAGRGAGGILNTASTAAFQPLPGQAGYAATKAFVLSYSRALGAELRSRGVTVTALCPGPVETEFGQRAGFSEAEVDQALPRFMWVSAEEVARQGVDGLERGRPVVIPGVFNAAGSVLAHLAPRRVLMPILARQHPALRRDRVAG